MTEIEKYEHSSRRWMLDVVRDAKRSGLSENESEAALHLIASRHFYGACRAALRRMNPVDYLIRSEKLLEINNELIADVVAEVYGVRPS